MTAAASPVPFRKLSPWLPYGLGASLIIPIYFAVTHSVLQSVIYDVVGLTSVIAILIGIRRYQPRVRSPWILFAIGNFLAFAGDGLWTLHDGIVGGDPPFPWFADAVYLSGYPFMALGLLALVRAREPGGDKAAFIDSLIVAVGLGTLAWVYLMTPYLEDVSLTALEQIVAISYPAMDLLLLSVAVRMLNGRGTRNTSHLFLIAGIALFLFADTYWGWAVINGRYHAGDFIDIGWLLANISFGVAALHPSMASTERAVESSSPRPLSRARLIALGAIALTGPVILAVRQATTTDRDTMVLIAASGVLFVLALMRVAGLAADLGRALRERTLAQQQLLVSEERFRGAFEHAPIGMALVDHEGRWRRINRSLSTMLGYTEQELRGMLWWMLLHPDEANAPHTKTPSEGANGGPRERRYIRRDGHVVSTIQSVSVVPSSNEEPELMVWQIQDVTTQKQLELELRRLSLTDPLTGLPNRTLFADRLAHALSSSRSDQAVAVLFIDLDRFKSVNDSLGHASGDRLLSIVAERLAAVVPSSDTIARFGGDEFVALLEGMPNPTFASDVAEQALAAIRAPIRLSGREALIDASIGVAVGWPGRSNADDVLRNADFALYRAKAMGRSTYAIFDSRMDDEVARRTALESDLRRAVTQNEFTLHYQPIVDLTDRHIVGMEALVRWVHPTRGLLAPGEFIDLAEETGLIIPMGALVLDMACRQAASWQPVAQGRDRLELSVNVSPRQLRSSQFLSTVVSILDASQFPPDALRLELTEQGLIEEGPAIDAKVEALRALGVTLEVDDFGTGYSSLGSLQYLPISTVKIDRSFVAGLNDDPGTGAVVEAIIALARALKLAVTAEGIETEEQYDRMRAYGCSRGQGYLIGPPVPAEAFALYLEAERATR